MAITETKIVIRPNTGIPFFTQTENPVKSAFSEITGPHTIITDTPTYVKSTNASGSHIVEHRYSEDLLTQTSTRTFDSMETFSAVETAIGIALNRAYFVYTEANGFTHPSTGQYTLTGIVAPFTCTTTYTYSSDFAVAHFFEIFVGAIEASKKLTSFINTGSQLIAVHTYTNSTDFTNDYWRDFSFVGRLNDSGVTRTIAYAVVSSDA